MKKKDKQLKQVKKWIKQAAEFDGFVIEIFNPTAMQGTLTTMKVRNGKIQSRLKKDEEWEVTEPISFWKGKPVFLAVHGEDETADIDIDQKKIEKFLKIATELKCDQFPEWLYPEKIVRLIKKRIHHSPKEIQAWINSPHTKFKIRKKNIDTIYIVISAICAVITAGVVALLFTFGFGDPFNTTASLLNTIRVIGGLLL